MTQSEMLTVRAQLRKAKPFVKWAGGKQRLLEQYEQYFPKPDTYNRYIEPFVGGGAVFFHLWNTGRLPREVLLSDNNEELVNAYVVVRDRVEELILALAKHKEKHSRDHYYKVRTLDRLDGGLAKLGDVDKAARMIYLNKTCYNGLYRVNSKGQFNVPLGSYKDPRILEEETLTAASEALQEVRIEARNFDSVEDVARDRDFVYFDPPYYPLSATASFTSYTKKSFSDKDQRALGGLFRRLHEKGSLCMLSNSDTEFVWRQYRGFRIETVYAGRAINSDANGRGTITELVVLSYR